MLEVLMLMGIVKSMGLKDREEKRKTMMVSIDDRKEE